MKTNEELSGILCHLTTMAIPDSRETFRFRDFELDVAGYELRRKGRPVRLERQPMDLLILLVERRGQLIPRGDIIDRLWGKDVFVDVDTGVHTAIRKIRQALHDSPESPAFVETVSGKGYRFIAPVEIVPGPRDTPLVVALAPVLSPPVPDDAGPAPVDRSKTPSRVRLALLLVALLLFTGAGLWLWLRPPRVTIAVLPFANLSGTPDRDYLAEGLAEETIASLGQIDPERLNVVARTSTRAYRNTSKSATTIGHELGADYLVESSIRAEGGLLRVTSTLIRARDQVQVWSQSYNRAPTSMLGLQQELSVAIAEQIRLRLSPDRLDALTRRQTQNADAYDLYLRGRNFANQRTPATTRKAIEYYERATQHDPNYALAWAGISNALTASSLNSDASPLGIWPRAREAAAQAVRAGPNLAEALSARGHLNWCLEWDWAAAETDLRRAVAIDPRHVMANLILGHVLSQMGRHEEAAVSTRRARDLDPLFAMSYALSSQVAFQARDYQAALEHARQAVLIDAEFWVGHMMLGQAYLGLGETDRALEALTLAARFSDQNSKALSLRGYILAKGGRASEARDVRSTLEAASRTRYVPPFAMASVSLGLGEHDAAFSWLERAFEARDPHLIFLTVDSKWDPIRADPRFAALLERCGFNRTRP